MVNNVEEEMKNSIPPKLDDVLVKITPMKYEMQGRVTTHFEMW